MVKSYGQLCGDMPQECNSDLGLFCTEAFGTKKCK